MPANNSKIIVGIITCVFSLVIAVASISYIYGGSTQRIKRNETDISKIEEKKADRFEIIDIKQDLKEIKSKLDKLIEGK